MASAAPIAEEDIHQAENENLGASIRARRLELGMGVRDLARATGLSATFISKLEHGRANPTLDTLRAIANALDAPLFRLLAGPDERDPVVRRRQRRRTVVTPGHVSIELMVPDLHHKMVLFQVHATAADGNLVGPPLMVPTEECILVVQGSIAVTVSGQVHRLQAGDSIYVEGRNLEAIRVTSEGEASFISAMTPPAF
jgi:transcriptional regulator with XRE-family HTH domain